jgi:hypothetical protein
MRRAILSAALVAAAPLAADPARVVDAAAERESDGWRFSVTLRHGDTGWEDYADGWRVLAPSGEVLGTRELLHPHVTEQPFTRALAGVAVPEGLAEVRIESSTNKTGWSGETLTLRLTGE